MRKNQGGGFNTPEALKELSAKVRVIEADPKNRLGNRVRAVSEKWLKPLGMIGGTMATVTGMVAGGYWMHTTGIANLSNLALGFGGMIIATAGAFGGALVVGAMITAARE